ncbi:PREDICTED: uncharacterized protein LOC101311511 isoform X2 [Fragaria vesca subsp. vesca]|uniref:uncharacterized protein LOC101311511 isoform X2 n=1 Tax=Fragaria vesca subsp. vesca TaxID=101020 RepID=UPI0002C2ED02|nr:PREDICTED: uncharacterized protein LOC101311511 isoform X2 [Fragaria vesca subsp. vesca]
MGGGTVRIDFPIINIKPSSSSTDTNKIISNILNFPVSNSYVGAVKPSPCSASQCYCGNETCRKKSKLVYGNEEKRASGSLISSSVFGSVPSQFEVQTAIASLLNFILGGNSPQSELQWLQKLVDSCVTRKLLSYGHRKVYDAFQLLQADPSVQRLVLSLSSDKALWDAITNNELVKKLQEPPADSEPDLAACIIGWIMEMTKAKVLELVEKFQSLVYDVFLPRETKGGNLEVENKNEFEEKVRSSLLLSIVTILIVVVARLQRA